MNGPRNGAVILDRRQVLAGGGALIVTTPEIAGATPSDKVVSK